MKISPTKTPGMVKVDIPLITDDSKKKVYCPLCRYQCKDYLMDYDYELKTWVCSYCRYVVTPHQDPVEQPKLVAGNSEEQLQPYMVTKDLAKRRKVVKLDNDVFSNPLDAWNS